MNDRYLFRGKRTDNGQWVEGFYHYFTDAYTLKNILYITTFKRLYNGEIILTGQCEIIPETIGQYTGLADKNGKKIFEGDVVNVNTNKDNLCHRYEGKRLVIRFDEYHRFVASGRLEYPLLNHYEWEVIGNIHDNPELLKGE